MKKFNFDRAVKNIMNTPRGRERSMYPHVRDLFVWTLGHDSSRVISDSRQESGNAPDLVVRAPTEVLDRKGKPIMHDWAVVEIKDEPDAFGTAAAREKIFNEKAKYIVLGTEYFVMADTCRMVVRPVALGSQLRFNPADDVELAWDSADEERFRKVFEFLGAKHAEEISALKKFRDGDTKQIAVINVDLLEKEKQTLSKAEKERLSRARGDFLDAVRKSTAILQGACIRALKNLRPEIAEMQRRLDVFSKQWKGYTLAFEPVKICGKDVQGMDEQKKHGAETRALASYIRRDQPVAKLAARALPAYFARTGSDDAEPFALESANLILARILLLRFFEDREFFGGKKYVCNGGVAELQRFMRHRERGYAVVLETAYYEGARIYADAFDYTDLDWVLKKDDPNISRAVELAMFYFSRFNFSTVSGDILTGIYDRFLDRNQRKEMGEFYTPPSVARYILARLKIKPGDVVFDPACGSGTFLLEAFERITGGDIAAGLGNLAQAEAALRAIGGNDLNPFSAVMARIQFLWHLLPLKEELKKRTTRGHMFPEIRIDDSYNSLLARDLAHRGTPFEWFDEPSNDAVIGNPPYVRPERAPDFIDAKTRAFFSDIIGKKGKNLYDLFVYKALAHWCKKAENGQKPGRLGFVIPLSFCDSKNSAPLRRLFAPGGQFRITEITDMEIIAPHVFDAAVNPIILFAENRPAKTSDKITIRVAGESCVVDKAAREFNFAKAAEEKFDYAEIWTSEGRVLTKTNRSRQKIIAKMRCGQMLADISRSYWTGRNGGNKITKWRAKPPEEHFGNGDDGIVWEEKRMLSLGASFRRKWKAAKNGGMDFYKGENIRACLVEGAPVKRGIIPGSVDEPSLWKYLDILPARGYAFLRITLGVTAARFNPQETVFLDTATLLFPDKQWETFPVDAALLSRIFQFYYAVYLRESPVSKLWSHLYARTLRTIPWPAALKKHGAKLEKLRADYLRLCEDIGSRAAALTRVLEKCGAVKFADARRARKFSVKWSDKIQKEEVKIDSPKPGGVSLHPENGEIKISLDGELPINGAAWFAVGDKDVAARAAAALTVFHGLEIGAEDIKQMQIPKDAAALAKFKRAVADYEKGAAESELEKTLDAVDAVVGGAFGLSAADIKYIQTEMATDDFLRRIRPNAPFSGKKQRGLLGGLDSSARYGKIGEK